MNKIKRSIRRYIDYLRIKNWLRKEALREIIEDQKLASLHRKKIYRPKNLKSFNYGKYYFREGKPLEIIEREMFNQN